MGAAPVLPGVPRRDGVPLGGARTEALVGRTRRPASEVIIIQHSMPHHALGVPVPWGVDGAAFTAAARGADVGAAAEPGRATELGVLVLPRRI